MTQSFSVNFPFVGLFEDVQRAGVAGFQTRIQQEVLNEKEVLCIKHTAGENEQRHNPTIIYGLQLEHRFIASFLTFHFVKRLPAMNKALS